MSEELPSKRQAIQILKENGCPPNVIKHCVSVARLAKEMAMAAQKKGLNVNVDLVEDGALLHDIGRIRTHSVHHALEGARIARSLGLPEQIVLIIQRHVGGGISSSEAGKLGWPKGIYTPQTLEEKIVSYADKLTEGQRRVPIARTLQQFSQELPPEAVERIRRLHEEMQSLIGDCECKP